MVRWEFEDQVKLTMEQTPIPSDCPPNRLFVTVVLRSAVIQWARASIVSHHPGIKGTLARAQQRFWWPTVIQDIQQYITAYQTCVRNLNNNKASSGLLKPRPTPQHPWSHGSLDFVTSLPPLGWKYCHFDHGGPVLQDGSLHPHS